MERDLGFNFKLLVPPRVNTGKVSAIKPQEVVEKGGDFMNTQQQGYGLCFDKGQNRPFSSTNMPALAKQTRQDVPKMKVVSPVEKYENNCNPGQLYAKLYDEFERIKCWKVKTDSDTTQKERRLQENKRTMETQRKTILELQFANESLSNKLEEQISENEDLRNRDNATRNLCSILKDTFQRSAEKMHHFESEREETHQILIENNERIQKMVTAFESLQIQVETDQQEMQKVKESFVQFDEIKEKYCHEYNLKEKEIAGLQSKLERKEIEVQKMQLDLQETHKCCQQLQLESDQHNMLLKTSETERESLLERLHAAEQHCEESQKNYEASLAAMERSKAEYAQLLQSSEINLEELSNIKIKQAEKEGQIQVTINELQKSLGLESQRATYLKDEVMAKNVEIEKRNNLLCETIEQSKKKEGRIKILDNELDIKSKSIESLKATIEDTEVRMKQLTAELLRQTEEVQQFKNEAEKAVAENDLLKKDCDAAAMELKELKEMFAVTEMKVQELEEQLLTEKKNEEHVKELKRDIVQQEVKYEALLSTFNELQSENIAMTSKTSDVKDIEANMKVSEEKAGKLTREMKRLEGENRSLREEVNFCKTIIQDKCQKTETLQKKMEEHFESLQKKIADKEKQLKSMETKLNNFRKKVEIKLKTQEEYQKENKILKRQLSKEVVKTTQLENVISSLEVESQNIKTLSKQDHQKMLRDLENKSGFVEELEKEVQTLRLTAAEALKNQEDAEVKCQQKIADMVTLMEKHKIQCDRMVEEKDAEVEVNKTKEMEAVAQKKSLELDLLTHQNENDQLKKEMKTEKTKTANLRRELTDVKKELSSMKISQMSEARISKTPASNYKVGKCSQTPKECSIKRRVFDFSGTSRTPIYNTDGEKAAVMKNKVSDNEGTKSKTQDFENDVVARSLTCRASGTSKIKSYRIRTPPSDENAACFGNSTFELDPKSDSSDQSDLITFASAATVPSFKLNAFKKKHSPYSHKSPGNLLKLSAVKRMRDAGWTAVTGCDKKKKKNTEKIFA